MMHEIEEKNEIIRSWEEVKHYKNDHKEIQEFRICEEHVRKELHNLVKHMYAGMKFLYRKSTQIMDQFNKAWAKNTKFSAIIAGLNAINMMDNKKSRCPTRLAMNDRLGR
jgi:hypothetical protein